MTKGVAPCHSRTSWIFPREPRVQNGNQFRHLRRHGIVFYENYSRLSRLPHVQDREFLARCVLSVLRTRSALFHVGRVEQYSVRNVSRQTFYRLFRENGDVECLVFNNGNVHHLLLAKVGDGRFGAIVLPHSNGRPINCGINSSCSGACFSAVFFRVFRSLSTWCWYVSFCQGFKGLIHGARDRTVKGDVFRVIHFRTSRVVHHVRVNGRIHLITHPRVPNGRNDVTTHLVRANVRWHVHRDSSGGHVFCVRLVLPTKARRSRVPLVTSAMANRHLRVSRDSHCSPRDKFNSHSHAYAINHNRRGVFPKGLFHHVVGQKVSRVNGAASLRVPFHSSRPTFYLVYLDLFGNDSQASATRSIAGDNNRHHHYPGRVRSRRSDFQVVVSQVWYQ